MTFIMYIIAGVIIGWGLLRAFKKKLRLPVIGDGHKIREWKKKRSKKKKTKAKPTRVVNRSRDRIKDRRKKIRANRGSRRK